MMTLDDYLLHDARLYPDKTAVVCGAETCSYRELDERVSRRAAAYQRKHNQVVLLRASQSVEFLVDYFAIHRAGAIAAPIEHDTPDATLARIEATVERAAAVTSLDGVADVLFTTGTTGQSKGVMISHRAIMADAENLIAGQGFTHGLTFVVNGPLNHIGSLSKVFPVIVQGATLSIIENMKDLQVFFSALSSPEGKVATFLVPASVRILTQLSADRLAALADKIDFIESGGAPLSRADMLNLCRLLPHTRLYNTYASTETGIVSTYNYNDGECIAGCLGHPMPHSRIAITADGHIACQGDTLMSGYLGEPELTATVLSNGTVTMADLGQLDNQGRLHIGGREDDVINVGGYKVAPTEVEEAALTLGSVKECVCIAVPHPITGNALKLLVVTTDGQPIDKRSLARHLKHRLEQYKVPTLYEQADAIERTYNGKINRKFYR